MIASGDAPPPYNNREARVYFRAAVDAFCEQFKENSTGIYGDSDVCLLNP